MTGPADRSGSLADRGSGSPWRGRAIVPAAIVASLLAWNVARYGFISDDAYISFRYARHLADGNGLVYNPGERVEGYTNFLWVILMATVMRVGGEPEVPASAIGVASGFAILALLVRAGARTSGYGDPFVWIAPAALAANRTFAAWCTGGLATQFFSLTALLGLLSYLGESRRRSRWPLSAVLLATATLTRPEGALFFAIAALFFAYEALVRKRRRWQELGVWSACYGLIVGTHVAWRLAYYGYPLPNTFYAKVSGFWWEQSRHWLGLFFSDHHLVWFMPLLLLPLIRRRSPTHRLFFAVLLSYLAYLSYVGGDFLEFRLMTPILPYLYWLLQEGLRELAEWPQIARVSRPGALLLGGFLVVGSYAPNLTGFDGGRFSIASLEAYTAYTDDRVREGRVLRRLVEEGFLTGDEVLAVGGAGALPYFSALETVDFRGLTDATVAHQETRHRGGIGHEKAASYDYLVARGVVLWDVENRVVQPPGSPPPQPHHVVRDFYQGPVSAVLAGGHYLVFATTLDEDAFRRVFSRCEILFYRPASSSYPQASAVRPSRRVDSASLGPPAELSPREPRLKGYPPPAPARG